MIKEFVTNYLFDFQNVDQFNFQLGYVIAVVVFLLLLLGIIIIRGIWFGFPKRCNGIKISGLNGTLFITAGALSDLVKSIGLNFNLLEIIKVKLLEKKASFSLELHVAIDNREKSFSSVTADLRTKILESLSERFGIDSIKEVNIFVKKINTKKNGF